MKKLLGIVVLGLLWCNVGFAKEIFYLQCPLKSEVNKTPKDGLPSYTQVGKITELRFFKLQIKKSSAYILIHSIMLMDKKEKPMKLYSDKLKDDELDLKNRKFMWNYFDDILTDTGTLENKNDIWEASGVIIYKNGDKEIINYSHRSNCSIIDKKTYKNSLQKKYNYAIVTEIY